MPVDLFIESPPPEDWHAPLEDVRRAMSRAVELVAQEVWGNVRRNAPVDEGALAGAWAIEQQDDLSWRIFNRMEYAEIISEGRGEIVPVNASVLVFEVGGVTVFAKRVGPAAPNPYVENSIEEARGRIDEFIARAFREEGIGS